MENCSDCNHTGGDANPGLPVYFFAYMTVINAIIFIVGVFGNTLVIIVVCHVRAMRNSTNFFLFTLSIADLCVLLVCQPVAIMEFYAKERWYIGEAMCKMVPMLENGVLHVSILTMIGVTTERFYSIVYPFRNLTSHTDIFTIKVIVFIWIIAFVTTTPFVFITKLEDAVFYDGSPVQVCRTKVNEYWQKVFIITNNVTFFVVPFFVLTYMYTRIIKRLISESLTVSLRNDNNARVTLRARKQVVRTLILILILFFVCMCPIQVVSLWQIFASVQDLDEMGIEAYYNILWFARIMMYINSAGNPVIYNLSSSKFKLAFQRVLMRCRSGIRGRNSSNTSSKYMMRMTKARKFAPYIQKPIVRSSPVRQHFINHQADENRLLSNLKMSSNPS